MFTVKGIIIILLSIWEIRKNKLLHLDTVIEILT